MNAKNIGIVVHIGLKVAISKQNTINHAQI